MQIANFVNNIQILLKKIEIIFDFSSMFQFFPIRNSYEQLTSPALFFLLPHSPQPKTYSHCQKGKKSVTLIDNGLFDLK